MQAPLFQVEVDVISFVRHFLKMRHHALLFHWQDESFAERGRRSIQAGGKESNRLQITCRHCQFLTKLFVCAENVTVEEDARRLYHSMHTFLRESGIDGVKCDVQVCPCLKEALL